MNKEINFSRFVGIAIIVICIFVVVLALLSAIMQSENKDNMVYVENGSGYTLSVPKSNLVLEIINIEKEIDANNNKVNLKVRLPKINIETDVVDKINNEIYDIYQNIYDEVLKEESIEKINIDYSYEYEKNDTILEITIKKEVTKDNKTEEQIFKFSYDLVNNVKI